jgi:hypothetical protein
MADILHAEVIGARCFRPTFRQFGRVRQRGRLVKQVVPAAWQFANDVWTNLETFAIARRT